MLKIPGKIPVSIYPFFGIVAFLIGWMSTESVAGTLIWAGIILVSVLVHEYGHALTAVAFGQKAQIELVGFGGLTQRTGGGRVKFWKEFIIVLNGPLAGFCLSGVAWSVYRVLGMGHSESLLSYAAGVAFYVNLYWTILNLLPVQPLDGGKLLSIILESIFGLKGKKIALFISLLLAAGLGIFFFAVRDFLIGSIFMLFTFESYRSWKQCMAVTEEDQNFILQHLLKEAENNMHSGHKEDALIAFQRICQVAKGGVIHQTAIESTAQLLAEKGELKQAYETLKPFRKKLSSEGVHLFHQLTYSQQHWEEAIALGDSVYHNYPGYEVAIINAMSYSALGRVKPAINWLQCAIQDGIPHLPEVLAKREFDPIRSDPDFRTLTKI